MYSDPFCPKPHQMKIHDLRQVRRGPASEVPVLGVFEVNEALYLRVRAPRELTVEQAKERVHAIKLIDGFRVEFAPAQRVEVMDSDLTVRPYVASEDE